MSPPFHRDATSGFWGYPTSTMDWCEENYAVTYGIAEFWNTISNIVFLTPPLLTVYYSSRQKLLEHRFIFTFLLLAAVGFGSFLFHCTLLYESQLLDELPMVYGTCSMIYCIVNVKGETDTLGKRSAVFLTIVSAVVSLGYMLIGNPNFFLWSYGLLAAVLFILHIHGCLKYRGSKKLLIWSAVSYLFGFLLWNIDNELCYTIRDIRSDTPLLLKPMTQLHAWWHLFAGIGTFLCILFSLNLRLKSQGYEPTLRIIYKIIPYYVKGERIKPTESKVFDYNGNHTTVAVKSCSTGSVESFTRLL